jgi:hypothetical protein
VSNYIKEADAGRVLSGRLNRREVDHLLVDYWPTTRAVHSSVTVIYADSAPTCIPCRNMQPTPFFGDAPMKLILAEPLKRVCGPRSFVAVEAL